MLPTQNQSNNLVNESGLIPSKLLQNPAFQDLIKKNGYTPQDLAIELLKLKQKQDQENKKLYDQIESNLLSNNANNNQKNKAEHVSLKSNIDFSAKSSVSKVKKGYRKNKNQFYDVRKDQIKAKQNYSQNKDIYKVSKISSKDQQKSEQTNVPLQQFYRQSSKNMAKKNHVMRNLDTGKSPTGLPTQQQLQQSYLINQKSNSYFNNQQANAQEAQHSNFQQQQYQYYQSQQQQYNNFNNHTVCQQYLQKLQSRQVQKGDTNYNYQNEKQEVQPGLDQLWLQYQKYMNKRLKIHDLPSYKNLSNEQKFINGVPIEVQAQYNAYREWIESGKQMDFEAESAKIERSLTQVNENNFDDIMNALGAQQQLQQPQDIGHKQQSYINLTSNDKSSVNIQQYCSNQSVQMLERAINSKLQNQQHNGLSQGNIKQDNNSFINLHVKRKRYDKQENKNLIRGLKKQKYQDTQSKYKENLNMGPDYSNITYFQYPHLQQSSPPSQSQTQHYQQLGVKRKFNSSLLNSIDSDLSLDQHSQVSDDNSGVNELWNKYQDSKRIIP